PPRAGAGAPPHALHVPWRQPRVSQRPHAVQPGTPSAPLPVVSGGQGGRMAVRVEYAWRGALTDTEMTELVRSHGGRAVPGWWDQIRLHSLGWVTARQGDGTLIGFV